MQTSLFEPLPLPLTTSDGAGETSEADWIPCTFDFATGAVNWENNSSVEASADVVPCYFNQSTGEVKVGTPPKGLPSLASPEPESSDAWPSQEDEQGQNEASTEDERIERNLAAALESEHSTAAEMAAGQKPH